MIASVTGKLAHTGLDWVVVEVGGVGLQLSVPPASVAALAGVSGEVSFFTHLVVREDALVLYGFRTLKERETFDVLLGVSGIGPRTALAALSVLTPGTLAEAVEASDLQTLQKVPGIGKKSAQRMVLELGGKLVVSDIEESTVPAIGQVRAEVQAALEQLGWSKPQAEKALGQVDDEHDDASVLLRETLAILGGNRG